MQPYHIVARSTPRLCQRVATSSRNMFTTPFFPHFNIGGSDFAPIFRLLDSATADLIPSSARQQVLTRRTFTPRFDVREVGTTYELQGELPGIDQKDLDIEFVDERTIVIRGRTTSATASTNANAADTSDAAEPTKAVANETISDTASEKSANYRKASVEDEEYVDASAESSAEGAKTPNSHNTVASTSVPAAETAESKKAAEPSFHYWVSERSVGEFERRFSFPGRVNQEAVKASLRNGILSVVVPKVVAKEARRIDIE